MTTENKQILELEARAAIFSLLAQAFNYPDREIITSLRKGEFPAALLSAVGCLPNAASVSEDIAAITNEYTGSGKGDDELLLELEKDYTHMFFSSKPRLVYLFESVYNEGKLLQESTFQIARLYYDAGLRPAEHFKMPPDHIAVEFEFLSYLYFNEIKAIETNNRENAEFARKLQGDVINHHLATFGRTFAEKVAIHGRTVFYRMMGKITSFVLAGIQS
ncbi:MAG TPA: molecular chaperone TorD family protein [Syntrophales bacterium]|nr:molecular chaperone TorD family protein [Syntrophales bacterium]